MAYKPKVRRKYHLYSIKVTFTILKIFSSKTIETQYLKVDDIDRDTNKLLELPMMFQWNKEWRRLICADEFKL